MSGWGFVCYCLSFEKASYHGIVGLVECREVCWGYDEFAEPTGENCDHKCLEAHDSMFDVHRRCPQFLCMHHACHAAWVLLSTSCAVVAFLWRCGPRYLAWCVWH